MFEPIALKNFLFTLEGINTYLYTNNDSFPPKYRHESIHFAELYRDMYKDSEDGERYLQKYIKSISFYDCNKIEIALE